MSCNLYHKGETYGKQIHRLVAEAFIPNDVEEKKHVNHKNHNRLDNRVENLAWVTASENNKHAYQNKERKSIGIPIIRWDLDMTNPVRYDSVSRAKKEFGSSVYDSLAGRTKKTHEHIWTYENERENIGIEIDLNEFKPIENHPNYLISREAQIYNRMRKKFLTQYLSKDSYMSINVGEKHYYVHRLVALNFIDKPENYEDNWVVNHKDSNRTNNSVDNLEWVSSSDNSKHMLKNSGRKTAKPVVQKDLEGNIVGEHLTARHAHRALGCSTGKSAILQACKNPKKPVVYGFIWEFKNV